MDEEVEAALMRAGAQISALHTENKSLRAQVARLTADAERLRYMLAVRVAGSKLYGDDGELQDNSVRPTIDFKRDSVDGIEEKLIERGLRNFAAEMSASLATKEQTVKATNGLL